MKYDEPKFIRLDYCFYCNTSLPATNQEHIFNSSWTGKHKTGSLICNGCNAAFASEVDKAFMPYTQFHMNVWSLKNTRRNEVPSIKTNDGTMIAPGAKPESRSSITLKNTGENLHIKASAKSRSDLKRLIKDAFRQELNKELDDVALQKLLADKVVKQVLNTMVELSASFDPQLETRSVVHTILKCMAMFDPNSSVNVPKHVLNFSRYGHGNWENYAVRIQNQIIDVGKSYSNTIMSFNAVEIHYLNGPRMILGKLTILRDIHRWVILSTEYEGPTQVLFVAEPSHKGVLEKLLIVPTDVEKYAENTTIAGTLTVDNIAQSLVDLSQKSLGPDAIIANLLEFIEVNFRAGQPMTNEIINKYKTALELFLIKMTELIGLKYFPKNPNQVHERILTESYFLFLEEKIGTPVDKTLIYKSLNEYVLLTMKFLTDINDS